MHSWTHQFRARVMQITFLFLSLTVVGCESVEQIDAAGEAPQELLNDQTTVLQPEVGMFGMPLPKGNFCTGTLISDRWFITASHCIDHERQKGGWFHVISRQTCSTDSDCGEGSCSDKNGPKTCRYVYDVDETFVLGAAESEGTNGSPGDDVAIGRLAEPVPASIATPARIADQMPKDGTQVTQLGFGCTVPNTAIGNTVKRYNTFTFPDSYALCKGDSGGPLRLGPVWKPGELVSVTVASYGNGTPDIIAHNLINLKPLILAKIAGIDGFEFGLDRFGFDYKSIEARWGVYGEFWGAYECRSACNADSKCRAFSYVHNWETCFLKSAAANPTPQPKHLTVISGVNNGREYGVDRPGQGYTGFVAYSPFYCEEKCSSTDKCQSYTWVPRIVTNGKARRYPICYLKSGIPDPRVDKRVDSYGNRIISGVRRGLEIDIDRPGSFYGGFRTTRVESCQSACNRNNNCKAWSYQEEELGSPGYCSFKNAVPGKQTREGFISGVKGNEFKD